MIRPMPPPKKGSNKREVLSGLPRSRPQRPSARREKARAAAKPKAAGAASAAAKSGAKGAAATPAAARSRAKGAAAKPKAAASRPKAGATRPKVPRGQSHVPPAGYASADARDAAGPPSGTELISTAVQAAGELVEIGATLGRQALKSALSRLPRP